MSSVRSARIACSLIVLLAAASAIQAHEPPFVLIRSDGKQGSGVVLYREYGPDGVRHVILTANHVVPDDNATIDGATGKVVARDKDSDLAIVRIELPKTREILWYPPKWMKMAGKAKLHGFPGGEYEVKDCTVDANGDLDCKVRGGGSGGPLMNDGYVVGILTRYHGVATSKQIHDFLGKHNFLSFFEPKEPK
jgi:hypothetical protein